MSTKTAPSLSGDRWRRRRAWAKTIATGLVERAIRIAERIAKAVYARESGLGQRSLKAPRPA